MNTITANDVTEIFDTDFGDSPYHGNAGPTPIRRPKRENFAILERTIDTITERLGHPWAPDHNAPGSTGVSPFAFNGSSDLRRVSTNDAYVAPAPATPNMRINCRPASAARRGWRSRAASRSTERQRR